MRVLVVTLVWALGAGVALGVGATLREWLVLPPLFDTLLVLLLLAMWGVGVVAAWRYEEEGPDPQRPPK